MDVIPIYAWISLVALAAKLSIIWYERNSLWKADRWFFLFFCSLVGINALEFTGFFYPSDGDSALFLMLCYYASATIMGLSFLGVSIEITNTMRSHYNVLLKAALVASLILLFIPGLVVSGVQSVGYTSTRIAGPLYPLFQIVLTVSLISGCLLLTWHSRFNRDVGVARRSKLLLLSILPIVIVAILVVALMQLGIRVTGSVLGSLAIVAFLIMFLRTRGDYQPFFLLSHVPATAVYRLLMAVRRAVCELEGQNGLQATLDKLEVALINDTLDRCRGNKSQAARRLGISRTTLRRKIGPSSSGTHTPLPGL